MMNIQKLFSCKKKCLILRENGEKRESMEKIFRLKENGTSVRTEILAGLTTFMTMAYIIALNPNLLTNFDVGSQLWNGVFMATCIASAIAMFCMAFLANKPFALAPGMGLNSFFAVVVTNIVGLTGMTYVESFQAALIIILIEGDSKSEYKNVDEAFRIAALLPKDRYVIWYVSYNGGAKDWYRVDRYLHRVPHADMPQLYQKCHILLKTSILESFSYPPLEMMATGGFAVVQENDGNREYLADGENCLFYDPSDLSTAVTDIGRIADDPALRERLKQGGQKTVAARDWAHCEEAVLALYA